jgi:acetylornithine deacetylase/succinyl-diaminopimelate desuccinylase-like protein
MELFSWAGHDAKMFSEITDTVMMFMPSIGGKSHCPSEYTKIESFELVCDNFIKLFKNN